jgi:hypothetical protein
MKYFAWHSKSKLNFKVEKNVTVPLMLPTRCLKGVFNQFKFKNKILKVEGQKMKSAPYENMCFFFSLYEI